MISQETEDLCWESLLATIARLEKWEEKHPEGAASINEKEFERGDAYNLRRVAEQNHRASRALLVDSRAAVEKMKNRTWGICVDCGEEIDEDRLVARPEASRCKPCQEKKGLRVR